MSPPEFVSTESCTVQLLDTSPSNAGKAIEAFVVKHYIADARPSIKGNGFDGLSVGESREEAEEFVAFINREIVPVGTAMQPAAAGPTIPFKAGTRAVTWEQMKAESLQEKPPASAVTTIYLVRACTDYEGNSPVRAFEDRRDAEVFKAECEAYNKLKPTAPDECVDTPENDAEHAAWWSAHQAWVAAHPGGDGHAFCTQFDIAEIPFLATVVPVPTEPAREVSP